MILFYLHQSAHIIDKIRESNVELCPYNPYSPKIKDEINIKYSS